MLFVTDVGRPLSVPSCRRLYDVQKVASADGRALASYGRFVVGENRKDPGQKREIRRIRNKICLYDIPTHLEHFLGRYTPRCHNVLPSSSTAGRDPSRQKPIYFFVQLPPMIITIYYYNIVYRSTVSVYRRTYIGRSRHSIF